MRCPTLSELPSPPAGKAGWPWTEESSHLPELMPDGEPWPRVSIVTPSYNQGQFLEETIRSVLLQGYPNLEYIVIDGGSTDESVKVIRKYEPWLTYWVSEKDEGQSQAINKGFRKAEGAIFGWMNSDDFYLPGALSERTIAFQDHPGAVLIYGDCRLVDLQSQVIGTWLSRQMTIAELVMLGNGIPQQSVFMRADALQSAGGVGREFHYIMDYELWVRLSLAGSLTYVSGHVACFRRHGTTKTSTRGVCFALEELKWFRCSRYLGSIVTDKQLLEAFRHRQLKVAQEYLFLGDEANAVRYLQEALQKKRWPHGNLDVLARNILYGQKHGGDQSAYNTTDVFKALRRVLRRLRPARKGRRLWRRIDSHYHVAKAFELRWLQPAEARRHLLHALWMDRCWLGNGGVWSIGARLFLGNRLSGWLRLVVTKLCHSRSGS